MHQTEKPQISLPSTTSSDILRQKSLHLQFKPMFADTNKLMDNKVSCVCDLIMDDLESLHYERDQMLNRESSVKMDYHGCFKK